MLKISDFGVAEELDKYSDSDICYQSTGTPRFQAPEIAAGLNSFKGTFTRVGIMLQRFFKISHLLEQILMEYVDMKNSLDSRLQICSICSVKIRPR